MAVGGDDPGDRGDADVSCALRLAASLRLETRAQRDSRGEQPAADDQSGTARMTRDYRSGLGDVNARCRGGWRHRPCRYTRRRRSVMHTRPLQARLARPQCAAAHRWLWRDGDRRHLRRLGRLVSAESGRTCRLPTFLRILVSPGLPCSRLRRCCWRWRRAVACATVSARSRRTSLAAGHDLRATRSTDPLRRWWTGDPVE